MARKRDLRNYLPFRGERFFAATRMWEWSEVGIYVWALWEQWSSGRAQVISDEAYQGLPERVRAKFQQARGGWRNAKCAEEYREAERLYRERSTAGSKGGTNRALRAGRLKRARARGTHTEAEWAALVAACGFRCVRCGAEDRPLVRDHIVPIYQEGGRPSDAIGNIQPLCGPCNSAKGSESSDWRPSNWLSLMKIRASKHEANASNTTPHHTTPHPVPSGQRDRPANPLVAGRRPELEAELNRIVTTLAEREDRDPTEVMADLSSFQGRSVMNAAAMSDDRLAQTLRAARKKIGNGDAPREPPPPPGDCDPEVYRKAFAASMEAGEPFDSSVSFAIEEGRYELKRPGGKSPWQ